MAIGHGSVLRDPLVCFSLSSFTIMSVYVLFEGVSYMKTFIIFSHVYFTCICFNSGIQLLRENGKRKSTVVYFFNLCYRHDICVVYGHWELVVSPGASLYVVHLLTISW